MTPPTEMSPDDHARLMALLDRAAKNPADSVAQRFAERVSYQAFLLDFLPEVRAEERQVAKEISAFIQGRHPLQRAEEGTP